MKNIRLRIISVATLLVLFIISPMVWALASDPDLNNDGIVDVYDMSMVGGCFGQDPASMPQCEVADTNDDGVVDFTDIMYVSNAFGQTGFPVDGDADSDGDGVADSQDQCPGFDDSVDVDGDGIPDGCDSLIDVDGDGVSAEQGDCNDSNSAIYPGAPEIPNNDIDENCDGNLGISVNNVYIEYNPSDAAGLCDEGADGREQPPLFKRFPNHELDVVNHSIINITDEGSHLIFEVLADVVNKNTGRLYAITGDLLPMSIDGVEYLSDTLYFSHGEFEYLEPLGTNSASPNVPLRIRVPKEATSAVAGAILSDCLKYDLRGQEVRVMKFPPRVFEMDRETIDAYYDIRGDEEEGYYVEFTEWTDFLSARQPGDIIVFFTQTPEIDCFQGGKLTKCQHPFSPPKPPWEVVEVKEVYAQPRLYYRERTDLNPFDFVESGYFAEEVRVGALDADGMHQSSWDILPLHARKPDDMSKAEIKALVANQLCFEISGHPVPKNEDGDYGCHFAGRYLNFNNLAIGSSTSLQGGLNIRMADIEFGVRFRDGKAVEAGAEITVSHNTTAVVHAEGPEVTEEWEQDILTLVLPVATFSELIDFDLVLTAKVGGDANFTGPGSFGLAFQGKYGVNMHVDLTGDNKVFSMTPILETEPQLSSVPTLLSNATMNTRIWTGISSELRTIGSTVKLLSMEGRTWVQLDVDPDATPWWSMSTGADLGGSLLDIPTPLGELSELLDLNYEANLISVTNGTVAEATIPAYQNNPIFASGETVRWARDIDVAESVYGDVPGDIVHLGGGDLLVVERSSGSVLYFDNQGNLIWDAVTHTGGWALAGAIPFSDGVLMVGGSRGRLWTYELDWNGKPVGRNYVMNHDSGLLFGLNGVLPFDDNGRIGIIVYGYRGSRAFAARLAYDPADNTSPLTLVWAKTFNFADAGHDFKGGVLVEDGMVLVNMGIVVKLDMDGNVVWSTEVQGTWGREFKAVAVLPNGDIVAGGGIARPVVDTYRHHSFWIARFDGETGFLIQERSLSEDLCPGGVMDTGCIFPGYTTPGASIYDVLNDLTVLPDGTIAATGQTSLGTLRNLWVVRFAPEYLRAIWFVTVKAKGWDNEHYAFEEGTGWETGLAVTDAGDGIAVLGQTTRPAYHGFGNAEGSFPDMLLMKLPYDGGLRFRPGTGMQLRYNEPDMVPPWGTVGVLYNLSYTVEDVQVQPAVSETRDYSTGVATVYDIDPW